MKMRFLLLAALSGAFAASAASPRIVEGSVTFSESGDGSGRYKITYLLDDAPGIVTADIFTNGVSIGSACIMSGDVNRLLEPDDEKPKEIWWTPVSVPQGFALSDEDKLTVKVTAWKKESPPDYLAVRLDFDASGDVFRYYASSNTVPGGVADKLYKTDMMLFRKVPAAGATYRMGSPAEEAKAAGKSNETQHDVRLTNDYYVAVYPMTRAQYKRIKSNTMYVSADDDLYPAIQSYNSVRGSSDGAKWPENDEVDSNSIVGVLRERTGMRFDLLTEAEWEYACRAGTTTALNSGKNLTNQTGIDAAAEEVAVYKHNSGEVANPVGCHLPNALGLYDMHGCVYEWCLDWYVANLGSSFATSPVGPASSEDSTRVLRGGYYKSEPKDIRSAFRTRKAPTKTDNVTGVRLKCPVFESMYAGADSKSYGDVACSISLGASASAVLDADEESPFVSVVCRSGDSKGMNFVSKPIGTILLVR